MNRRDKIKLLKAIASGRKPIDEILPQKVRIWVQDETDPNLWHCQGITKRRNEIQKRPGFITINVIRHSNTPPFAQNETEMGPPLNEEQ